MNRLSSLRRYTTKPPRQQLPLARAAALVPRAQCGNPFPDLSQPDALLDTADVRTFPRPHGPPNRLVARNDPSLFEWARMMDAVEDSRLEDADPDAALDTDADTDADTDRPIRAPPPPPPAPDGLHVYPLIVRRVTQQTGKGKIHRMYALVVVGNGAGLVGCGAAKDAEAPVARARAHERALRSLEHVARFEARTLWSPVVAKLGATRVHLRPRPVGFGLHCAPLVHQVLKAAGIKDASAKVWGSRNPLAVVKTLLRVLHAGHAPLAMGDGVGGGARRLDKGSGLRSKDAVERDRGRKLLDLRTY